jgi:hypothetical protein
MNTRDKKKYEYVIGIDLGHGETSAAICPLQWDTLSANLDPVKDLEMGGNRKVIPSAITILEDGSAYIGDAAFNPEVLKKATVRVCFKQAPKDINGEAEKTMIRFMHEVYVRIRENNQALLQDGNHLVYIATPSGWNKDQQALYMQMAEAAGIPIAGVTKESRAAFVRAQQDVTSGLGKNIHKGAIVFDMGSSTLDFTYMNDANENLIDYGYDCGASLVEKTIYGKKREDVDAIQTFEAKYPKLVDYLLFQARAAKEKVYFDPTLPYKKTINFEDIIDDEELEDERFKFTFQPGQLDELLTQTGYLKKIEDAMIDFRQNKINGQPIYGVFLTGGASRMDFINDLVCKSWGVTQQQVYRDTDPSLTISQGVAEVARIDLRTEGGDVEIAKEIAKLEQSDEIFESFATNYGHMVWDDVTDTIIDTVRDFCESTQDRSANQLQTQLRYNIQNSVSRKSSEAVSYLQEEIDDKTQGIKQAVDSMVRAYARQGTSVTVPELKISSLDVGSINMDSVVKEISDQIVENSTNWLGIGGLGLAAILFGIPGLLIGWGLGKLFGKSEEEKKQEAMSKPLDYDTRQTVWEGFAEKWDGEHMSEKLHEDIISSVANNRKIKQDIQSALRTMLDAYKRELKNARILVD